jgi:amino acid adenylation domain-containing protein
LDFPAQKLRPLVRTYHGSALRIGFPQDAVSRLRQHSQALGGTLFMGILTCLKGFLGRYTSQDDIILGSSIAGQEHADLADQAGFYVNTVALRTQFDRTNSFHELFVKVRETLLGAFEHRLYPLHRLIDDLGLKKGLGRSPLFDIVVSYEGVSYLSSSAIPELPGLEMSLIEREHRLARFDITFGFIERPDGLVLDIEYNTDIHERHMMEQFGKHFRQFVENAAASPDQPLNTVVYMSEAEQVQVTSVFNSTTVAYPISQTLIHVFFAQAGKTPDNIAVQAGEMTLTYSELDAITNRFARYLAEKMFGDPNELIAIKLERDAWLIVSILAVLKSGNAYLPIDPAYSQLRIDYIMESSNCQITIDKDMIDDFISEQQNYSGDEMPEKPSPSDLAYVIYTSGSTGHPKGVMIEHKSILNTILSQIELFEITAADHCLQFASQSFDASVSEIFVTLLSGAQLSIVNEMEKRDISLFSAYLREKAISWATIPPAYIKMLEPETLNAVNKIVTAGEQAYVNKALMSRKSGYYINAYGPTETSICAAVYKGPVRPSMPIGKPIHNTRIYILDDFGTIVPVGITGEIHIAGAGLARGYLKRRDLTEASFMADPFNPGEKFYKTGDFGRWLPDGTIEFTGRRDTQVKVNGYRIELEEIENVLTSLNEWVSQVALDVREVKHEKVIVAYVVGKKELDKIALRDAIAQRLPAYMIPNYFVEVAEIPLNQSGKVDRKALPEVQSDDVLQAEYVAPANETEHKLAEIWQEVLALDKVGTTDKFFDIGGTSLKLIELHKRINEAFNTQINIVTLFRKPTIGEIGKELQERVSTLSNQPDNVVNVIPFENEG